MSLSLSQELVLRIAGVCRAAEALASWHVHALQLDASVARLQAALDAAAERLCDAESVLERQAAQVARVEKELLDVAGKDAEADMMLECSFQRLVQGNALSCRRLLLLLRKVRWSMVPEGFISARLQQHPLVVRFGSRPELQQVLLHAPGVPRIYI